VKKQPEIDGKWVEIDAVDLLKRKSEVEKSEILVITSSRIELGGSDKEAFEKKMFDMERELLDETEGMDDEQRSFYIMKKMLLG
jgi:hypothetical protein